MEMTPGTVVADAYITHLAFQSVVALDRDGKGLCALCRGDDTAVTVGLLDEVVVLLDIAELRSVELLIPLYGAKVCGGKKSVQC